MTTPATRFRTLFLCTGNSARSIFAECFLRAMDGARFEAFSAGSEPRPEVNPFTLRVLEEVFRIDASGTRPKSWRDVADIPFDFVITVCDNARETCPVFPGHPVTAHWGFEDPAAFVGDAKATMRRFTDIAFQIRRRIELFTALPLEKLDHLRREQETRRLATEPLTPLNS